MSRPKGSAPQPNRYISNTVRRPYATPGGIRQTLRPSTAPRTLSQSISAGGAARGGSPLNAPSANGASSSTTGSPDDDKQLIPPVPRLPAAPHTSYQPRTLPLTQSASVGSMLPTSKRPALADHHSSSEGLPKIDTAALDTTLQMDRAIEQLASLLKDDSDDDEILGAQNDGSSSHPDLLN